MQVTNAACNHTLHTRNRVVHHACVPSDREDRAKLEKGRCCGDYLHFMSLETLEISFTLSIEEFMKKASAYLASAFHIDLIAAVEHPINAL